MSARILGLAAIGSLLLIACTQETEAPDATEAPAAPSPAAPPAPAPADAPVATTMPAGDMPDRIVAERGGFIPEGVEYDQANDRFLTGSLAEGSIFEIADDGSMTAVVQDPELVSSVGIEVDEPRDRLLVANSDRSVFGGEGQGQAKLGVYRLTTGERIAMVDLAAVSGGGDDAVYFANDVTVTDDGTIFVTDTRMNVVYRVDGEYQASVFHRFEPMEGLGLNGIVHHEDGYLIVVASGGNGILYKIPLDDPAGASQVQLPEPATGADGLVWAADGTLAVVSNSTSSVLKLASDDGWATAAVAGVASFEGQATTGAAVGDAIYVVQPHFAGPEQPVILRADF